MLNQKILGIINFDNPILFCNDTLGKKIPIIINNVPGTFIMPLPPKLDGDIDDTLNKTLIPPKAVQSWKVGKDSIIWGYYSTYSDCVSNIEKALLEFEVPKEQLEETCNKIYAEFDNWINLFTHFLRLITKQNTRKAVCFVNKNNSDIRLYSPYADYYQSNNKHNLIINFPDENQALNEERLREVCNLASQGQPPKLEYKILLEAYNARMNNDPRKAIIEAANALEICITNRIIEEFDCLGITFGNELLKKFRMLGGRFELMDILGIVTPTKDYNAKILEPRNDVIHRAKFSDMDIANEVILSVEKYLEEFSTSLI